MYVCTGCPGRFRAPRYWLLYVYQAANRNGCYLIGYTYLGPTYPNINCLIIACILGNAFLKPKFSFQAKHFLLKYISENWNLVSNGNNSYPVGYVYTIQTSPNINCVTIAGMMGKYFLNVVFAFQAQCFWTISVFLKVGIWYLFKIIATLQGMYTPLKHST